MRCGNHTLPIIAEEDATSSKNRKMFTDFILMSICTSLTSTLFTSTDNSKTLETNPTTDASAYRLTYFHKPSKLHRTNIAVTEPMMFEKAPKEDLRYITLFSSFFSSENMAIFRSEEVGIVKATAIA